MKDVTICIKTFERPDFLHESILRWRTALPYTPIFVADDSKNSYDYSYLNLDKVFYLPYDLGLSVGRNILLDAADTEFVIFADDDNSPVLRSPVKTERALNILKTTSFDLVAGKCGFLDWCGTIVFAKGVFWMKLHKTHGDLHGLPMYDFVPNFFMARTESLRAVRFDNDLKVAEHTDFSYRFSKAGFKQTMLEDWNFENSLDPVKGNDFYLQHRFRHQQFVDLFKIKHKVEKFIHPTATDYLERIEDIIKEVPELVGNE